MKLFVARLWKPAKRSGADLRFCHLNSGIIRYLILRPILFVFYVNGRFFAPYRNNRVHTDAAKIVLPARAARIRFVSDGLLLHAIRSGLLEGPLRAVGDILNEGRELDIRCAPVERPLCVAGCHLLELVDRLVTAHRPLIEFSVAKDLR